MWTPKYNDLADIGDPGDVLDLGEVGHTRLIEMRKAEDGTIEARVGEDGEWHPTPHRTADEAKAAMCLAPVPIWSVQLTKLFGRSIACTEHEMPSIDFRA